MAARTRAGRVRLERGDSDDLDVVMQVMDAAFDAASARPGPARNARGSCRCRGRADARPRRRRRPPVGFSLLRTVADEAELLLLAVAPDHHRRGIGARCSDDFIDRAREGGAARVHLEVRDGNPAIAMYRAAGFELGRPPAQLL